MLVMEGKTITTIIDVIRRMAHGSSVTLQDQAKALDVRYSTFANAVNSDMPRSDRPAYRVENLVPHMLMCRDFRPLEFMAMLCGKALIDMPKVPTSPEKLEMAVARATKEFGDVLTEVATAMSANSASARGITHAEAIRIEKEILEHLPQVMLILEAVRAMARSSER